MRKPNKITSDLIKQTFYPKSHKELHKLADNVRWFNTMTNFLAGFAYKFEDNKFKCFTITSNNTNLTIIKQTLLN